MNPPTTRLSRRSHQETLKAHTGTTTLVDLLSAEACQGTWRIVEVVSASGGPFELRLAWSAGDGAGQEAKMTVARGTRFSIFASWPAPSPADQVTRTSKGPPLPDTTSTIRQAPWHASARIRSTKLVVPEYTFSVSRWLRRLSRVGGFTAYTLSRTCSAACSR